ncbi:MAG: AAA family ATPase [Chloroflexi bacterium]|nr:AAA family ATPase [Chloroflexota bacterium]
MKGIVLAIDADPSSNLCLTLGLHLDNTIGRVREEMTRHIQSGKYDNSVAKQDYLQLKVMECLVESDKVDLLAMGRPEGPGCYCAANNMLRVSIDRLGQNYDYIVIDCEAGMEHISRQTTRDIDILIIVSDTSIRGLTTAAEMKDLMRELRTNAGRIVLVINRVNNALSEKGKIIIEDACLEIIATIPEDPNIGHYDANGIPLTELPANSPLQKAVLEIAQKLKLTL